MRSEPIGTLLTTRRRPRSNGPPLLWICQYVTGANIQTTYDLSIETPQSLFNIESDSILKNRIQESLHWRRASSLHMALRWASQLAAEYGATVPWLSRQEELINGP